MYNSGSSLLTKAVNDIGFVHPTEPIEANSKDNTDSYCELEEVVQINNKILKALGQSLKSVNPIQKKEFSSDKIRPFKKEIINYLSNHLCAKTNIVLNDPRLCRLLPLWSSAFEELNINPAVLLIIRQPEDVYQSLIKHSDSLHMPPIAITERNQSHLLWLRYNIEAELHSRNITRLHFSYEEWVNYPDNIDQKLHNFLNNNFNLPKSKHLPNNLTGTKKTKKPGVKTDLERLCQAVYQCISKINSIEINETTWLNEVIETTSHSIPEKNQELQIDIPDQLLTNLYNKQITSSSTYPATIHKFSKLPRFYQRNEKQPIIFVSDSYKTRSHIYRVKNPVDSLNRKGQPAYWVTSSELARNKHLINCARKLIFHRNLWNSDVEECVNTAQRKRIPVYSDFDDLIFDKTIIGSGHIHFINKLSEEQQQEWMLKATLYKKVIDNCETLICSTPTLSAYANNLGYQTQVIENGFSGENLKISQFWRKQKNLGKYINRIGYASGTGTHDADFSLVIKPLTQWLKRNPDWILTIVGVLDTRKLKSLIPQNQLEIRPLVNPINLAYELSRFTVNIIPLEINPFCNAKSPLKWYESAICGVPTIATNNSLYNSLFDAGKYGLTAGNDDWENQLGYLAKNPKNYKNITKSAVDFCEVNYHSEIISDKYL